MNQCRCCDNELPQKPILTYTNMPKSAQHFPTEDSVNSEEGVDLFIFQCAYCGLIQIPGDPVSYFRNVIRATGVSQEMKAFRERHFGEFARRYSLKGKRIIEIGAGSGEFMKMMKTTGAEVFGLEHQQSSIDKAEEDGLQIYQGFVEGSSYQIPGAPYDAFYIMNFLEHIPEPKEFLKGIYKNLHEDAIGIIEVPNFNMILEKQIFSEFIRDHLLYFTKETLRTLLESNGFEVLECQAVWYDYILSAIVRRRKHLDISTLTLHQVKIVNEIREYITNKKAEGKKVAVWGAGHQALAVLSLADLADEVESVIDSAKFKQDKYTPATHIPTVAPEVLREGIIGAVLVMAAGYSDEIAGMIRDKYPNIAIAILRDYGIEEVKP